jgi:MOSC domain-containing protein YiiM
MRVIREGHIQVGDQIIKTRTGPGALTVADADALLYLPARDHAKLRLATQIPADAVAGDPGLGDFELGRAHPAIARR